MAPDAAPERETAVRGVEPQVAFAVRVRDDQPGRKLLVVEQRLAVAYLDPIDHPFGAILVGIGATGATATAVEFHERSE